MSMHTDKGDILALPENYQQFYQEIARFIPSKHIFADPIRTLAYGVDASLYRITPKLVVKIRTVKEVSAIFEIAGRLNTPVTIRAAGTSLSGQALTDSVLLVMAGGWSQYRIDDQGEAIMLEPGILGAEANSYLKPYARKIDRKSTRLNSSHT
jgi:D-lactate dehydrogenase